MACRTRPGSAVLALCATLIAGCVSRAALPTAGPLPGVGQDATPHLAVSELLASAGPLAPSSKARALSGKRVRLSGFVADMDRSPPGAFYLVPRPLHCDEAGGGSADLPPDAVLVTLSAPGLSERAVEPVPGAVEVVGTFEVGNRADAQGWVANFWLRMDAPAGPSTALSSPPS